MTTKMGRRGFLKMLGIGAGALAVPAILPLEEAQAQTATAYGVLVDTRKCIDCKACQVACKVWNSNQPDPTTFKTSFSESTWCYVQEDEVGYYDPLAPNVQYITTKRQCMHCVDPVCIYYCPMGGLAIHKEPDGPVVINHDNCIRCASCVHSCPYSVPRYDATLNKIVKCDFCFDRLRTGEEPACVSTCVAGALQAGTMADITALANAAAGDGYPVYGLTSDEKTSWIYIFPKGVAPEQIIKIR